MLLTLRKELFLLLALAVIIGLAIGAQATLVTRAGRTIGAFRTSLSINFLAGSIAGLVILSWITGKGISSWQDSTSIIPIMVISGVFNIVSITGFAFVLQRLGVTATLSAVIFGQMMSAVVIDKLGLTGGEPIPIDPARLTGLAIMALGVVLLVPRN